MIATRSSTESDDRTSDLNLDQAPAPADETSIGVEPPSSGQQDILSVINELEDELVRCEELRLTAERRADETAEQAKVTARRNQKLRGRVATMQKRISELERKPESAVSDPAADEQVRAAMARHQERIETLGGERDRLKSELHAARERAKAAEAGREQDRKLLDTGKQQCARLERETQEARGASKESERSLAQTISKRDELGAQLKQVCAALEAAKASKKTAVAKAEASDTRATALTAELEETAAAKTRIERKIEGAAKSRDRYRSELSGARKKLSQALTAHATADKKAGELNARLQTMHTERADLLSGLNQAEAALCETKVQRDRLQEELTQMQETLDQTHSAKAEIESAARRQEHRIAEMSEGADELNQTLRRAEADLNDVAAQRDELRSQLKATRGDLTLAKAARQDAESSAAAKSQRLGQLQAIVDDAFARQINSLTSENQSLSGRVGGLEHDNVSLAAENSRRESELRALQVEKHDADEHLSRMRTAVADFNDVLTSSGAQITQTADT